MKTVNPIGEIKSKLDIVEEVSKYVKLTKSSNRYVGFCPFHNNTNTPAFTVYPGQQSWWCYGCNQGGDVLTFLQKIENVELGELIRKYANEFGITLTKLSWKESARYAYNNVLYKILEFATDKYHLNLLWGNDAQEARNYLKQRSITTETIIDFRLGFAPASWDWLYKQLKKEKFEDKDIIAAGLAKPKRGGSCYDFYRERIIFPIQTNCHVMGFGARILKSKDNAKYINGPNTPVFTKQQSLYGLSQARQAIRQEGEAIVVEGYMDVLALHQAGFKNTVGIMGTSFTSEQAKLLGKHTKKIIFALDPDEAGKVAISRLKMEKVGDFDIYIASLPGTVDPDELVLENLDAWRTVLTSAKPIPMYMADYLIEQKNPTNPKEKRDIARQVIPLIELIKDPVEQAGYQEYLAKALGFTKFTPNVRCPHCGKKYYGDKNGK